MFGDCGGLPSEDGTVQMFTGSSVSGGAAASNFWHTWRKPRNIKIVQILAIGAGAGGGKGHSSTAGTARGGGGGGATGGLVRVIYLAVHVPDKLYIQTPTGGKGADGAAAVAGGRAYVSAYPTLSAGDAFAVSQGGNAAIGSNGTGSGQANGGASTAIATQSEQLLSHSAMSWIAVAGAGGSTGGIASGGSGTNSPYLNATLLSGGAGGGGVTASDQSGGGTSVGASTSIIPTILGGAAGSNNGNGGFWSVAPMSATGGTGGGASNSGIGGDGGNGAYGCGGGGGGGGTTGGNGGKGGDAIVWITCF